MAKTVDMFICGDIINQTTDEQFIDQSIIHYINKCDYSICNFEGTCISRNITNGSMLQRPSTLHSLKKAGFNLLLLANNHITDYGYNGLKDTISQIEAEGFEHIGAGFNYEEVYSPLTKTINGIRIGIINLCEAQIGQYKDHSQRFGYAWLGDLNIDQRIQLLKKDVDYVVLIPHAGLENYPLPLWQFRQLYRHWCDIGVDVIVGGHPHISQGIEHYGKSIIFYSLGNFFFSGFNGDIDTWTKGISCVLHFAATGVTYDVIQHQMDSTRVCLVEGDINQIKRKNKVLLNDEIYASELRDQNVRAFESLPMRLYMSALNGTSSKDGFFLKCKKVLYYLINRKSLYAGSEKYRMSVLKRLTENETYRFLTISAIEDQF